MDAGKRWRRAIIISIILNFLILCGIGILLPGRSVTELVEQVLELDLISEDDHQGTSGGGGGSQGEESSGTTATQMVVPKTVTTSTPVVIQRGVEQAIAIQTVPSLRVDEVSSDASSVPVSGTTARSIAERSSSGNSNGTTNGTGSGSGGILRPQILYQVDPIYPEAARQASVSGTVLLKVEILENGRAGDVSVKKSSGNDLLDESAISAVNKWRFTPAIEGNTGRAVACYTTVPVVFRLN